MSKAFSIVNTTRDVLPRLPFARMARRILGARYELSLVVCGDARARSLNRTYRKKGYAANVLSFPLSKHDGEIFLNVQAARREAKRFGVTVRERVALLFVHACLHLKGEQHGRKMERLERMLVERYV